MSNFSNKDIIKMLVLLELSTDEPYSEQDVSTNYRKLSKIYHPDVANERYKDGSKFKELLEAKDYLLANVTHVNSLIKNGFNSSSRSSTYEDYAFKRQYEEMKRQEEEARRKAEEVERKKREKELFYQECVKQFNNLEIKNDNDITKANKLIAKIRVINPYKNTQMIIDKINVLIKEYYVRKEKEQTIQREKERLKRIERMYLDAIELISIDITKDNKSNFKTIIEEIQNINYKDSREIYFQLQKKYNDYLEKEKNILLAIKKKIIKYVSISMAAISVLVVTIILIINLVIIPKVEYKEKLDIYNDALHAIELGEYYKAEEILVDMDFEDSTKVYDFLMARKEFNNGDYEKGIDYIYKSGGTVNIDYDAVGGKCEKTSEVIKLSSYVDNQPQKRGYEFNKWDIKKYDIDYKNYTVDLELIAVYDEIVYEISYELVEDGFIGPNTYKISDNFEIEIPRIKGYEFIGWKNLKTNEIIKHFNVNGYSYDLTLKAMYEVKNYIIDFDVEGGYLDLDSKTVEYDSNFELPTPTKSGYEFVGWFYGSQLVKEGIWNIDGNITLYAKWKPMNYTIEYQSLEIGEEDNLPQFYEYSDTNSYDIPCLKREGYTFISWILNEKKIDQIPRGYLGNVVLTPLFEPNKYKITYDYNDNTNESKTIEVYYNEEVNLEIVDEREYYKFEGWYLNDNLYEESNWKILNDIRLIAKWNLIEYKINYKIEQEVINPNPDTYNIKSKFSFVKPIRDNYTFVGWYLDENYEAPITGIELGSNGDIDLYPKWLENNYMATYIDTNGEVNNHIATSINVMTNNDAWIYSAGDIELDKIELNIDTNLILLKDCSLYISDSIYIEEGCTLTIYCEDGNSGELIVKNNIGCGSDGKVGDIGGNDGANLIIAGGYIEAKNICNGGDGFTDENVVAYGGWGGTGGIVTLYNGSVKADSICNGGNGSSGVAGKKGADGSNGIPSSWYYDEYWNEWFEIYATSPTAGSAGGTGGNGGEGGYGGQVYIYGGTVLCKTMSCGGTGGTGGAGGTGGNGGKNTSGVIGANGGAGGDGGWGGSGGLAGTITSIYTLNNIQCSLGGKKGLGGTGGLGGKGLSNGSDGETGRNGVDRESNEVVIFF